MSNISKLYLLCIGILIAAATVILAGCSVTSSVEDEAFGDNLS